MNMHSPKKPFVNCFATPVVATLADVYTRVAESTLGKTAKRDCLSALRRVAEILSEPLERISADLNHLRQRLEAVHPASIGLSDKTWSNLRSALLKAIETSGLATVTRTRSVKRTPEWIALMNGVSDDKSILYGLSCLARFCSANKISPDQVDDDVISEFAAALREGTLIARGNERKRDTARLWNRLVTKYRPDLKPVTRRSSRPAPTRVAWDTLPESFKADVAAYLTWCSGDDLFAEDARPRPLAKRTIELYRQQIHTAVTALEAAGVPLQSLSSLKDLVSPPAVKAILLHRMQKTENVVTVFDEGLAKALVRIAVEWAKVDAADLTELKRVKSKLKGPAPGLTKKNKGLLRKFEDPEVALRLFQLPDQLWRKASSVKRTMHSEAKARAAVAIGIEMYIGLRVGNLATLEFGRTLFVPSSDHDECTIDIPAEEMKNREPFNTVLPPSLTPMIRRYRELFCDSDLLFQSRKGGPVDPRTMSYLIERMLKRALGFRMTVHQFRHLCAKHLLDAEPGGYESARQLLGHRNIKTTVNYYAGIDTRRAGRLHASLIQAVLDKAAEAPPPKKRKRTKAKRTPTTSGRKTRK